MLVDRQKVYWRLPQAMPYLLSQSALFLSHKSNGSLLQISGGGPPGPGEGDTKVQSQSLDFSFFHFSGIHEYAKRKAVFGSSGDEAQVDFPLQPLSSRQNDSFFPQAFASRYRQPFLFSQADFERPLHFFLAASTVNAVIDRNTTTESIMNNIG
jgi:hypothetical protein